MFRNLTRYDRQMRIFKKAGQNKLLGTKIGLVGSDKVSDFLLADLLSIGVGKIIRVGRGDLFEFEKINPDVYFEQVGEDLLTF